jgi:hypothetical protein
MSSVKVKLFEGEFQKLVQGEVVKVAALRDGQEVEIILADIGMDRVQYAVQRAVDDFRRRRNNE